MSEKGERAKALFEQGYNCAQAVFGAFCEETGYNFESAMLLASAFGGGMGRMREVCGAVSGMMLVTSLLYGYNKPKAITEKKELYQTVQTLANRFKEKTGRLFAGSFWEFVQKTYRNHLFLRCVRRIIIKNGRAPF